MIPGHLTEQKENPPRQHHDFLYADFFYFLEKAIHQTVLDCRTELQHSGIIHQTELMAFIYMFLAFYFDLYLNCTLDSAL